MPYAEFDDGLYDDPVVLATSYSAFGLFALVRIYCAKHLTDGHLDAAAARKFIRTASHRRLAQELIERGLWRESGAGYVDTTYLEDNRTREKALNDRRKDRERKQRQRSSPRLFTGEPMT